LLEVLVVVEEVFEDVDAAVLVVEEPEALVLDFDDVEEEPDEAPEGVDPVADEALPEDVPDFAAVEVAEADAEAADPEDVAPGVEDGPLGADAPDAGVPAEELLVEAEELLAVAPASLVLSVAAVAAPSVEV
jgi:hypothetical protein